MIISAVALPSFMRAYRTYQLDDAATQVAGILKFTRYEAIRVNVPAATPLKAQILQSAAGTYVFADSNNNGTVQVRKSKSCSLRTSTWSPPQLLRTLRAWLQQ